MMVNIFESAQFEVQKPKNPIPNAFPNGKRNLPVLFRMKSLNMEPQSRGECSV